MLPARAVNNEQLLIGKGGGYDVGEAEIGFMVFGFGMRKLARIQHIKAGGL